MHMVKKIKTTLIFASISLFIIVCLSGCSVFEGPKAEISGTEYLVRSKELIIEKLDTDDYSVFNQFEKLEVLDVTAVDLSVDDYERLSSQVGEKVKIICSVPIKGKKVKSNASDVELSGELTDNEIRAISYFTNINKLTVKDTKIGNSLKEAINAAKENNPEVEINCIVDIYGVEYDSSSDILILNDKKIKSLDNVHLAIELFPSIKTIEMCNCGVSNQKMQELRDTYPHIKFVWTVKVLSYQLRTDIQVFSTLASDFSRPGNSKNLSPLFKYCTELRALDLGHMAITDLSEMRNLKKLHTLILADNRVSDVSPLADLKELVYIEIFFNRLTDVSPFLELPKLEDLNICYNKGVKNPTVLTQCKNIKKLYMSHCGLDDNEIAILKKGLPEDCDFNYTCENSVYNGGWRTTKNARNTKIREAFKNWKKVKEYPTWDNIIYK